MRAGIAVLLGVAWAAVVLIGIWLSFESGEGPGWVSGDGVKYFMPSLTALIGGVVATAFGVAQNSKAPVLQPGLSPPQPATDSEPSRDSPLEFAALSSCRPG